MSQMGRHFMATSDDRADEAERELSRLAAEVARLKNRVAGANEQAHNFSLNAELLQIEQEQLRDYIHRLEAAIHQAHSLLIEGDPGTMLRTGAAYYTGHGYREFPADLLELATTIEEAARILAEATKP